MSRSRSSLSANPRRPIVPQHGGQGQSQFQGQRYAFRLEGAVLYAHDPATIRYSVNLQGQFGQFPAPYTGTGTSVLPAIRFQPVVMEPEAENSSSSSSSASATSEEYVPKPVIFKKKQIPAFEPVEDEVDLTCLFKFRSNKLDDEEEKPSASRRRKDIVLHMEPWTFASPKDEEETEGNSADVNNSGNDGTNNETSNSNPNAGTSANDNANEQFVGEPVVENMLAEEELLEALAAEVETDEEQYL